MSYRVHETASRSRVLQVNAGRRRASRLSSRSLSAVVTSFFGHLLAQPELPNPSVKGTSRRRAAPYVER
jgi:hypothetical protein